MILATGGTPLHIALEGIDGENVMDAVDVLDGKVNPGVSVLVIGGGMTGVETADYMAEHTLGGFETTRLARGVRPYTPLEEAVNAMGKEVFVIGDAVKAGPANKATEAGLEAALML